MQAGREKITVNLDDEAQRFIAVGVLQLLERGKKAHEAAAMTQEIVKQVWYGYQDEQRGVDNDAGRP